jgi:hypothetical protein
MADWIRRRIRLTESTLQTILNGELMVQPWRIASNFKPLATGRKRRVLSLNKAIPFKSGTKKRSRQRYGYDLK